jgi:hypothetical protein
MVADEYIWSGLTPRDVVELLRPLHVPWWIAGGWAIDLFLGRETRAHGDIDVAMLRGDELAVRDALPDWDIHVVNDGTLAPWPGVPLERHQHQFWMRRNDGGPWDLEILFEDHEDARWLFRRDHRVAAPLDRFGRRDADGIAYVAAEIALLYKARHIELERNERDFDAALPSLDADARRWFADALDIAHPEHPWSVRLG